MEGREAMSYGGSAVPYFAQQTGVNMSMLGVPSSQSSVAQASDRGGSSFQIDNSNSNYQLGMNMGSSSGTMQGEVVKRKRGRPRKYGPDKTMSLVLTTPMSEMTLQGLNVPSEKRKRGRPPGTGRKQMLASLGKKFALYRFVRNYLAAFLIEMPYGDHLLKCLAYHCQCPFEQNCAILAVLKLTCLNSGKEILKLCNRDCAVNSELCFLGGWMNSSAGSAFAPKILFMKAGEDVAAKIVQISLQRPRALCISSGNGTVSSVSLRQPASSDKIFPYEGHFRIISLSGSYLVSEEGGSDERTGGLNISLSTPEGHILGGVIDGPLIADSPVQVVTFSFIYDGVKSNIRAEEPLTLVKYEQEETEPATPDIARNSLRNAQPLDSRNPDTGIDLMLG